MFLYLHSDYIYYYNKHISTYLLFCIKCLFKIKLSLSQELQTVEGRELLSLKRLRSLPGECSPGNIQQCLGRGSSYPQTLCQHFFHYNKTHLTHKILKATSLEVWQVLIAWFSQGNSTLRECDREMRGREEENSACQSGAVFLQLECAGRSPRGFVTTQVCGPHSQRFWFSGCYGPNVCVPPQFVCWNPNVMTFTNGTFGW